MDDDREDSVAAGAEEARRATVLRPLVQAYLKGTGSLESGINDAVWELGVSRATVWRWIKRLAEERGRTSALAPRKRGRPTGTILISSKVEAVIEEHLRRYFLRRERSSLSRVVTEIRSACWQRGLQPPTRRTVQRRLNAMDAREVAKAREGAKATRQNFAAVTGENKASQPLEVVQIDHTPADIILVDSLSANQLADRGSRWRSTSQRGW
jgi:putative transposase